MRATARGLWSRRWAALIGVAAIFLLASVSMPALGPQIKIQERHVSGQSIAPIFEGWAPNPDGTFNLYFGYMNRNYEEELEIPLGATNTIEPGVDQGQPTHFLPRRHKMVFAIVAPKDFGDKKTFTWTLSIRGNTEKAIGSLNPLWQVDASRDTQTGNTPPVMKIAPDQTVTMPAAATLTVSASDDGLPKPRRRREGQPLEPPPPGVFIDQPVGLQFEWSKYRGPGKVVFDPPRQAAVNGVGTTKATFSAPGDYMIQVVADDGSRVQGYHCCWTNGMIKVKVAPPRGSESDRQ